MAGHTPILMIKRTPSLSIGMAFLAKLDPFSPLTKKGKKLSGTG